MSSAPNRKTTALRVIERAPEDSFRYGGSGAGQGALGALRAVAIAAVTPLLEKNAVKTLAVDVPLVFSMSRIVVVAFAIGMVRQLWKAGITSWPEVTLAMTIVLALPMLGALERAKPEQTLELVKSLIGRFGIGDQRSALSLFRNEPQDPSRYDNHWSD
ncbi:MAG: hypothetical protein JWM95_2350 [Gemmatimonadetes bacterium]|nr:hypothetical protein [Gemmatimonadota bacterium]